MDHHIFYLQKRGEKKQFNKDYIQKMSNALVLYWLNVRKYVSFTNIIKQKS